MLDEGVQERREAVRRRGVVETATRMDGRRKRGDRPESARRALHARDAVHHLERASLSLSIISQTSYGHGSRLQGFKSGSTVCEFQVPGRSAAATADTEVKPQAVPACLRC